MTAVAVLARDQRITLSAGLYADPVTVPAATVLIEIESELVPSTVWLDGATQNVVRNEVSTRGYLPLDCLRSTGFHRLIIKNEAYYFATADAKLRLNGIERLLNFIGREGLSWGYQLLFSNGNAIRDIRGDYAWLSTAGPQALTIASDIALQPATCEAQTPKRSYPRSRNIRVPETLVLARSNPSLLEEYPKGLIRVHGRRWMPRRVIANFRSKSHDTVANRRITRLLLDLSHLASQLLQSGQLPSRNKRWVEQFVINIGARLNTLPFRLLTLKSEQIPANPSTRELYDTRYEKSFALHEELIYKRGWSPSRTPTDRFAYIAYSDEIYQAFVAIILSEALGTVQTTSLLQSGLSCPAFSSDDWALYYDTEPPRPQFTSWRAESSAPARFAPDYCLVKRSAATGILGDAKYRMARGGKDLPNSALKDCQAYMQDYSMSSFIVFYPGLDADIQKVAGDANTILKVSITPFPGVITWIKSEVLPQVESLLEPLAC